MDEWRKADSYQAQNVLPWNTDLELLCSLFFAVFNISRSQSWALSLSLKNTPTPEKLAALGADCSHCCPTPMEGFSGRGAAYQICCWSDLLLNQVMV